MVISSKDCLKDITDHYKTIGSTLLLVELCQARSLYRFKDIYSDDSANQTFREGVVCVPTTILKSYLEDLLKKEYREESLFIKRQPFYYRPSYLINTIVFVALATAFMLWNLHISLLTLLVYYTSIFLPLFMVIYRSPFFSISRRLIFAKLISLEIDRRTGKTANQQNNIANYSSLKGSAFPIANYSFLRENTTYEKVLYL
jgi:hypothetical protein